MLSCRQRGVGLELVHHDPAVHPRHGGMRGKHLVDQSVQPCEVFASDPTEVIGVEPLRSPLGPAVREGERRVNVPRGQVRITWMRGQKPRDGFVERAGR